MPIRRAPTAAIARPVLSARTESAARPAPRWLPAGPALPAWTTGMLPCASTPRPATRKLTAPLRSRAPRTTRVATSATRMQIVPFSASPARFAPPTRRAPTSAPAHRRRMRAASRMFLADTRPCSFTTLLLMLAACSGHAQPTDAGSLYVNPDCGVHVSMTECGSSSAGGSAGCPTDMTCETVDPDCGPTPTCDCVSASTACSGAGSCEYDDGTFNVSCAAQ